ncbi:MAG: sxtJ [Deltaproteobacteria bacterium]|nr:sxtJ [Deltaproteobacteria bacterium]
MSAITEIRTEINSLAPQLRDLRNLGLLFGFIGLLAAGWILYRHGSFWLFFLIGGLGFGLWGLVWPQGLRPVYIAWFSFAIILGYFVSRFLLTLVFFLAVTPIGLIFKLLGKDPLDRKLKDRDSYWVVRPSGSDEPYDLKRTEKMY